MISINNENLDALVRSGETLAVLFYEPNHVLSDMTLNYIRELDGMVGKDFQICTVNAATETDVADAFGVSTIPEVVIVKNKRIHNRESKILYANQILKMINE